MKRLRLNILLCLFAPAMAMLVSCQGGQAIVTPTPPTTPAQTATKTPETSKPTTVGYGSLDLTANQYRTFEDYWDLTKGDLVLSYDLDLSGITSYPDGSTAWTSVGISGGAQAWLASGCPRTNFQDPKSEDYVDKHYLKVTGTADESAYDATSPDTVSKPFGTHSSYGIWFDRNGIAPKQLANWGMIDGKTYNTVGKYKIVLTFHAVDSKLGTMFASINGVDTGFYKTNWLNMKPEIYPAGKSISGDLTKVQVQANQWTPSAPFGIAKLSKISVTGFPSAAKK